VTILRVSARRQMRRNSCRRFGISPAVRSVRERHAVGVVLLLLFLLAYVQRF
jgi:hypothetical protein